jgi:hypothetical protein
MSDSWLGDIGSAFGDVGSFLGKNANWLAPLGMVGATLYGANANSNAAQTQANALQAAAGQQQQSADNSLNFLRYAYDTSRGDQAPYRAMGQQALGVAGGQVLGGFQPSPGYQFAQNEAMRAVQNSAAARGMLNSGATMKALQDRAGQLANQEYGNWYNRVAGLANVGQTATNQSGAAAQQFGQGAAGVATGLGNSLAGLTAQGGLVQANGMTAGGNALMGGANSLMGYFSQNPGFWK